MSNRGNRSSTADWQKGRYEDVRSAHKPASQDGDTAPIIGRHLLDGAVRDPVEGTRSRIRVRIHADILDREDHARRIDKAQYNAGRTFQRLFEIRMGSKALDGTGVVRDGKTRDDMLVRIYERGQRAVEELQAIRNIPGIGERGEWLLRLMLVEQNPNTARPWSFAEVAATEMGKRDPYRVYALAERFREALGALAEHWDKVEVA